MVVTTADLALSGAPAPAGEALTADDLATLRHLVRAGVGRNSLRALRSDLAYLEAWAQACTGAPLPWPPDRALILRFLAHHLWDPEERARDPAHGMPADVAAALRGAGHLRAAGPHAPATVRRRLSSWRSLCAWREAGDPFADAVVGRAVAAAARAAARPRRRKSARAVDGALIARLMAHLAPDCARPAGRDRASARRRLAALRDRAMLALAFAAGGRRRAEIAALTVDRLQPGPPVADAEGRALPALALHLGRTKPTEAEADTVAHVAGAPVRFVAAWLAAAAIGTGPVFRRIDRWGHVAAAGIGEDALNRVLKARLAEIGEDPAGFSAHGLRAGFITEALDQGIAPQEVMGQTLHRSLKTTMAYYDDRARRTGRAARLMG